MLRIRLSRTGRKKLNLFRVVVAEHQAPVKGRFVEILGNFNPNAKTDNFKVNEKRLKYWLSCGAKPTDTVTNLLVDAKILSEKEKIKKTTKKKHRKKEEKAEKPDVIESPTAQKGEGSAMEIAEEKKEEQEKPEPEAEGKSKETKAEAPKEEKPKEKKVEPAPPTSSQGSEKTSEKSADLSTKAKAKVEAGSEGEKEKKA